MNLFLQRLIKILLLQIFLYSFFTEWIISYIDNTDINYYLEGIIFLFLFLPISLLLLLKTKNIKYRLVVNNILLFSIIYFVLPFIHFSILLKFEIFSKRIGTENIALIYGDMGFLDKGLMKIYDLSQFFFLVIGFFILKLNKHFKFRAFFKLVYFINLVYTVIFALFNGRSAILILVLLIIIIDGLFVVISTRVKKYFFLLALFSFVAVSVVRYLPLIIVGLNNDFKDVLKSEILYRVNCSKLLNEVYEASYSKGLLYGKTVISPLISVQALFGDLDAKDKIKSADTGAKQYILGTYLGKENKDDCSCAVVDSYANFAEFGVVLLSFMYFIWFFILSRLLNKKRLTTYHICLITLIVFSILLYETDGMALLFNLIKFIPIIILFYFVNPVTLIKVQNAE